MKLITSRQGKNLQVACVYQNDSDVVSCIKKIEYYDLQ